MERLLPYLGEIQNRLFHLLVVFCVFATLGFIYYQPILSFVMRLFNLEGVSIVLTSPYQFFNLSINTALAVGLLATLPLFIYYLLSFLKPALAPREFRLLTQLLPLSALLLVAGFSFGLWILNFVIGIFYQTSLKFNLNSMWDISHFFSQVLITAISLGIVFQFPIVLTGLLRLKVLQRDQLTSSRRYVYAACLLFATLLPPTDLLSLFFLTVPLIVLFELTLLFNPSRQLAVSLKGGDR